MDCFNFFRVFVGGIVVVKTLFESEPREGLWDISRRLVFGGCAESLRDMHRANNKTKPTQRFSTTVKPKAAWCQSKAPIK